MKISGYWKLLLPLMFLCANLTGQTKSVPDCGTELKGFIRDSQEYFIDLKETSTFDIIFYSGFLYRLELCGENINLNYNITLVDEKGNIQFKETIKPGFYRDFRFETVFHGKILVNPVNRATKAGQLLIGYKKL